MRRVSCRSIGRSPHFHTTSSRNCNLHLPLRVSVHIKASWGEYAQLPPLLRYPMKASFCCLGSNGSTAGGVMVGSAGSAGTARTRWNEAAESRPRGRRATILAVAIVCEFTRDQDQEQDKVHCGGSSLNNVPAVVSAATPAPTCRACRHVDAAHSGKTGRFLAWSSETTGDCEGPVRARLAGLGMAVRMRESIMFSAGRKTTRQRHSISPLATSVAVLQPKTGNVCHAALVQHVSVSRRCQQRTAML
jgi:hypothetical protein